MKPFLRIPGFFLGLLCFVLVTGCAGYRIGPAVPKIMEGVQTIAIPTFENKTLIPRLEVLAASTLIRQFQQDGTFRIAGEDEADVILEGTIADIRRSSARSVRGDLLASREYELIITVEYEVTRRSTGERIDSGRIRGETSFYVSGNDVNQDERQAYPLALEQASIQLVSRLSEGW